MQPHQNRTHAFLLALDLRLGVGGNLGVAETAVGQRPEVEHLVDAVQVLGVVDHHLARRVGAEDILPELDLRLEAGRHRNGR